MNPNQNKRTTEKLLFCFGAIFAVYFTCHIVFAYDMLNGKEQNILNAIPIAVKHMDQHPFDIKITQHFFVGIGYCCMLLSILFLALFFNTKKTRYGREHGDAIWATMRERNLLRDKDPSKNMILSNDLYMSMQTRFTRRNNSQTIVGGSGSGKTRYVAKPNILQMNCSYVITDPKGDLLKSCGKMLEDEGYSIRIFNVLEPEASGCYNPFFYIHCEADIFKLAKQVIKSTKEKDSQNSAADPFWDNAEQAWYSAIFSFIWMELPAEQQNFNTVMKLLNISGASEEDESKESKLDIIFRTLEEEKGIDYFPCKQYRIYKLAPGKTAKSILISAGVRLAPFNVAEISNLVATDTVDLKSIGDEKTVLFIAIPDRPSPYNFLVSLLYTQLFDELYFQADFGEIKWDGNKVLYRSKERLLEQKKAIKEIFEEYQRTEEQKKRIRLKKQLREILKEVEREFGIPYQYADKEINEKYLNSYYEAINDCLIRLRDRRMTLEGYRAKYCENRKKIKILKKSNSNYREKAIKKIETELEVIKLRLEYEYGIKKEMPKQRSFLVFKRAYKKEDYIKAERNFLDEINFMIKELRMNPQSYGTRQSLEDKREKIKNAENEIKKCKSKIKDTGLFQTELRKKYETKIEEMQKLIQRINVMAKYEFGLEDLRKRQKNGGRLRIHVRCILDEFANIAPIPEFDKLVATMRSREISVSIILQTTAQLKDMYKESYETIIGNCDTFIFLGGQEPSTLEYITKRLGKETIDKRSQGQSKGRQGSSSTNWDTLGRDLMTSNALTTMDNEDCIVFVRGYNPFYCKKYKLEKHPNYAKMGEVDNPSDPRIYDFYSRFNTKKTAMSVYDKQLGIGEEYKKMLSDSINAYIKEIDVSRVVGTCMNLEDRLSFSKSNTYNHTQIQASNKEKMKELEKQVEYEFVRMANSNEVTSEMATREIRDKIEENLKGKLVTEEEGQNELQRKIWGDEESFTNNNIKTKDDIEDVHREQADSYIEEDESIDAYVPSDEDELF